MAHVGKLCYSIPNGKGRAMEDFSWWTLGVKIASAAAGSFFSLAILKANSTRERLLRFSLGIVGGVIFGQLLYKHVYPSLEYIFYEGLISSIFAMSLIVYFLIAAAVNTFAGAKKLPELLQHYKDIRALLEGKNVVAAPSAPVHAPAPTPEPDFEEGG